MFYSTKIEPLLETASGFSEKNMFYNIFLDMGQFFASSDIRRLSYCTDKRVGEMPVRTKWQKLGYKKTGQAVACPVV